MTNTLSNYTMYQTEDVHEALTELLIQAIDDARRSGNRHQLRALEAFSTQFEQMDIAELPDDPRFSSSASDVSSDYNPYGESDDDYEARCFDRVRL